MPGMTGLVAAGKTSPTNACPRDRGHLSNQSCESTGEQAASGARAASGTRAAGASRAHGKAARDASGFVRYGGMPSAAGAS